MEASTQLNKLSNSSIGIGGNYNGKSLLKADPVVHTSSISKAEKRLKKLERDYQHTYEKYKKARSNSRYNYSFLLETIRSERHSGQIATCILHYNDLRAKLQNDLDKLNKGEARARGIDRHEHVMANVELVNNPTSDQDSLTISSLKEKEIKLLTEVIKKLKEESGSETRIDNGEEQMKHLEKICESICRKIDEEKKYIVQLKKKHDVL